MSKSLGKRGFTLSELLIALAILGLIATFTIPKVLSSQADNKKKAIAKEVAGMLSEAYQVYKSQNTAGTGTKPGDLTPYMNYIRVDTTGTIDANVVGATEDCNSGYACLRLHNGGVLYWDTTLSFGGTTGTHAIWYDFDVDGGVNNDSVLPFFVYYTGKIRTLADIDAGTTGSNYSIGPNATDFPAWFSWN